MSDRHALPAPSEDPATTRASSFAVALEESADPIARRDFLARMGAAMALAGLAGCTRAPREEIVPYVNQPPEVRPGLPKHYATATVLDGYAVGVLVESHTGRPTKIEGNPRHPASLGAAGSFEQASVLSLYDPSRARGARSRGSSVAWDDVVRAMKDGRFTREEGRGLHFLLEPTSSTTVRRLLDEIRNRYPQANVWFDPSPAASTWEGARIAFGRALEPRYAFDRADVVLALDADVLTMGPAALRHARHFADRRAAGIDGRETMNRLYVVEPLVTVTGAAADHRLGVTAAEVANVAAAIAAVIVPTMQRRAIPPAIEAHRSWIDAVAQDLERSRGRSLVLAGPAQPPEVHALVHALNDALGNVGQTVTLAPSAILDAGSAAHGASGLHDALARGEVDTLVILAPNPVYRAPRDMATLVGRARQSLYLGMHDDETAAVCTYAVARAHTLEAWGDARAYDGTTSIIQPLIEPLFGGRTELDVLALFTDRQPTRGHALVRDTFRATLPDDAAWRAALRSGIVDGSTVEPSDAKLDWSAIPEALARCLAPKPTKTDALELVSRHDPHVYDGRFAGNAWLLELPSPIEKLTWTNAATLSPRTAARLGITSGDEVRIETDGRFVTVPACVVPGQADGVVGLTQGWGRARGPELARGRGANAFALTSDAGSAPIAVSVAKTGKRRDLPITQTHRKLEGRDEDILRHRTLDAHRASAGRDRAKSERRKLRLYEHVPGPSDWQWAMTIDLSRCTGCSACVVACQAENNVPTVGPDNVVLGREMHWLRIDSYVSEDAKGALAISPQPMLCQHCEMAPCEYVCPVNATVHSPDGLNEMVYNRCVGTRFCSNNCPYKVRRFNWFDFHHQESRVEELAHNPDVTVRARGVMEKCTFCVQRLRQWEIGERQGRAKEPPRTACQQTCPTQAIVFGDMRDPKSTVAQLRDSERAYAVLDDLGTEPRVRYLARITNPNPEIS